MADPLAIIATQIINPSPKHNQISLDEVVTNMLADLNEQIEPFLKEWYGGDGEDGLCKIWARYETEIPILQTEEQAEKATEFGKYLGGKAGLVKKIEDLRMESTRPLNDAGKMIKNTVDRQIVPIETAITGLRDRLQACADKKLADSNKAKAEAERLAKLQAKHGDPEGIQRAAATLAAADKPIEAVKSERGASMETRVLLEYEGVENFDLVPREYLMVDEKKVRSAITAKGGITAIPGLIIKQVARAVIK